MKHRTDLDGLRAIAVLPVILFHAGYGWVPGGFVGVDVFFVISGFLISSILMREMQEKTFSFLRFYERRARRILPALLIVLVSTIAAAYFFLLPDEYTTLASATLAAISFVPNIYFWDSASTYFGLDIATQPLLHTWSLGIEEQFYILFPALLLFLYAHVTRKVLNFVLVALLSASLIANILLVTNFTSFTFYMIPTRAWELLAGVMLGIGLIPEIHHRPTANIVSAIGLALILGTMLLLDEHAIFPGINAVYPVLGSLLIIHANTRVSTAVSWLLSRRLLILIGLISYSLYLWHWPVTVFTQMIIDSNTSRLFIVAFSILLASISYLYIETRYRKPTINSSSKRTIRELGSIGAIATAASVFVLIQQGITNRIPDSALQAVSTGKTDIAPKDCRIFTENQKSKPDEEGRLCYIGKKDGEPQFIVWGDSHADAITHAFHAAALEAGVSGYSISNGGCRPLAGVYRKHKKKCLYFNNETLELIVNTPSIQQVFLAGYWRIALTSQSYDNYNFLIMDDETNSNSPTENLKVFRRGLLRTIETLKDRKVTIIEDIPEIGSQFGKSVANHFVRRAWLDLDDPNTLEFTLQTDAFETAFLTALENLPPNADLFRTIPLLCHSNTCPLLIDGKLAYSDGDHLSLHGATVIAPALMPYMASY